MRNPLTGEYGIYAPTEAGGLGADPRPLPAIPRAIAEASTCVLCSQQEKPDGSLVVATPNPSPLTELHVLFTWARHIVFPADATPSEWAALLGAAGINSSMTSGQLLYGNLGPASGASQPHLHAHLVDSPPPTGRPTEGVARCGLCTNECPTISSYSTIRIAQLPGGHHGEVVIAPIGHGERPPAEAWASAISETLRVFEHAEWTSSRFLFRNSSHPHVRLQPAITAGGALETCVGIPVSRWGYPHLLEAWFAARKPAMPSDIQKEDS